MEMSDYPGEYKIRLGIKTTKINSREIKLGGKTPNAPRILPVMKIVAEAIIARKEYIEKQMIFPCRNENGEEFTLIDQLPISCHGNNYTIRSSTVDISKCATEFFINKLHFENNRLAGISELMYREKKIYTDEKAPTCYTCRRDMATELSTAFHQNKNRDSFQQYYMGHKIQDNRFKRNDFTDEYYIHEMKELLEHSHKVNIINWK